MSTNGQLSGSELADIGFGNYRLCQAAADDFKRLASAFCNRFGKPLQVGSAYRPLGTQGDRPPLDTQWACYWYSKNGGPTAMYPGTSKHGDGKAIDLWSGVDIRGSQEHKWVVDSGPYYGFVWGDAPSEAWHFVYRPDTRYVKSIPSPVVYPVVKTPPGLDRLITGQTLNKGSSLHAANSAHRVVMQPDGNFVLYNGSKALWHSGTLGRGDRVVMQPDGNLVIYDAANKPLWTAGGPGCGANRLVIQPDGNLVLYRTQAPIVVWNTGTAGK